MPDWGPEIRRRLSRVRLAPQREAEIAEELKAHLDDRWRDLTTGGASPEEAMRAVLQDLGEGEELARRLAPLRQARWFDTAPPGAKRQLSLVGLRADLRLAVRSLRSNPGFALVTVAVLALGLGATTAIFSVVDAVVLRSLPFHESDRLVAVGERRTLGGGGRSRPAAPSGLLGFGGTDPEALRRVQPQNYLDWVQGQQAFESIAAIADAELTLLTPRGEPETVAAQRVTSSFFDVLRVAPALGRAFTPAHEVAGEDRVAILSDAFWRRRFAGNAAVVGHTLSLEGDAYRIIGVMPAGFSDPVGALVPTDLWVPYVVPANERTRGRGHAIYLQAIARLRQGVSLEQARAQMSQLASAIESVHPEWNRGVGVGVRPLKDHVVGANTRSWLLMLLAAVGMVLLIACANVAHLMLMRVTARMRSVAVRAALGATRWRLARQLVVESLLLSICGTALALALAAGAVDLLRGAMPEGLPRGASIAVDGRVFGAATILALVTGLLCGFVPALQTSSVGLAAVLQEGGRFGSDGRARLRLRHSLLVGELAVAVVLVAGAALFIASFQRVMRIDPGFRPQGVLTAEIHRRPFPGRPPLDVAQSLEAIVARLALAPGVIDAAAATPGIPLRQSQWREGFVVRDQPVEGVDVKLVTPGYHATMGISLRKGRLLTSADREDGPRVALINESAARRFFPGLEPIGQIANVAGADRRIVGVVADARQARLETPAAPEAYLPLAGWARPRPSGYVAVRTTGDPWRLISTVRAAALAELPNVPLRQVASLDQLIAGQAAQRRLTMLMLSLLGGLGLVITAVGVYGVVAYLVAQRAREIGVRMALGATRARVLRMVVGQGSRLVALGVLLGAAGAWCLAGAVRSFLYGIQAHDVWTLAAAGAVLAFTALLACALPARRAASIDPTVALRNE